MISLTHILNNWWPVWKVEIILPPNHTVTDQQKLYKMVYNSEFDNLSVDSNCASCIKRQSSKWIEGEYNYGWYVRDCWAWLFSCSILRLKCFECFRYNKLVTLLHPRLDEFIAVILRVTDSFEIHTSKNDFAEKFSAGVINWDELEIKKCWNCGICLFWARPKRFLVCLLLACNDNSINVKKLNTPFCIWG